MEPFCLAMASLVIDCLPLTAAVMTPDPPAPVESAAEATTLAAAATRLGVDPAVLLARLLADPAVTLAYRNAVASGAFGGTLIDFAADWALAGPETDTAAACADAWTAVGAQYHGYGYVYDPATGNYLAVSGCPTGWHGGGWYGDTWHGDTWHGIESWSYQGLSQ